MKRSRWLIGANLLLLVSCGMLAVSCGPSAETEKKDSAPPMPVTKETIYRHGHMLYLQRNLDSAQTLLSQAFALDSLYADVIADLAPLHFDLAMRSEAGRKRTEHLRKSRDFYVKLEQLGSKDSELYERICEIANTLSDNKTFLKYAKKNADAYPYDRQFYNLSVAYFNVEDFKNVITVCKDAIDRFKSSSFIGTYYRQLGRAYMKVDRDQTAEKTFYTGLGIIDARIAGLRKANSEYQSSDDYIRLKDDKIGILTSLKYLHSTYKAMDKLADVERKLKELGK